MQFSSQDLDILQFYIDSGVNEFISETSIDRFKEINIKKDSSSSVIELPKQQHQTIVPKSGTIEALKEAEELASKINSIEELKTTLENFNSHTLKRTASHTVFAEGIETAKIMLIGDTPSAHEDRSGRCFIGEGGALLDKMLGAIGISREENIYLTYMVNWYPPGNRLPSDAEISLSLPFIKKHIELINPDIIICLGDIATKKLLHTSQSVTRLHGKWHEYAIEATGKTAEAIPMFRPEYLLASPSQKGKAWADLLKLQSKLSDI